MLSVGTVTYIAFSCNLQLLTCRSGWCCITRERARRTVMPESNIFVRNRLLKAVGGRGFLRLAARMEAIELPVGHRLVSANTPISHVCFIETGLASSMARTDGGKTMENMSVGHEGATGCSALLGAETTPDETTMCVAGKGFIITAADLRQEMEHDTRLRDLLLGYINVCLLQVGQLVLANGHYTLRERLSRWLLMCHDRLETDDLPITHEFLSSVLGVRRPGITNELHILEGMHAIRATRGNVRIINRRVLEETAGTIYGVPEREYEKLTARLRPDLSVPSVLSVESIRERHHL